MENIWSRFFIPRCQIPHTETAFTAPALFSQSGVLSSSRKAQIVGGETVPAVDGGPNLLGVACMALDLR